MGGGLTPKFIVRLDLIDSLPRNDVLKLRELVSSHQLLLEDLHIFIVFIILIENWNFGTKFLIRYIYERRT
jgi:hypothetical protein